MAFTESADSSHRFTPLYRLRKFKIIQVYKHREILYQYPRAELDLAISTAKMLMQKDKEINHCRIEPRHLIYKPDIITVTRESKHESDPVDNIKEKINAIIFNK
jgi:hypothetical protein